MEDLMIFGKDNHRPLGDTSRAKSSPSRGIRNRRSTSNAEKTQQTNHLIINLEEEDFEICPINLEEGKVIDIEELEEELEQEIFHTENARGEIDIPFREVRQRCVSTRGSYHKIDDTVSKDLRLRLGDVVELNNGKFLEIKEIDRCRVGTEVLLLGWELRRTKDLGGELILKLNEVCYIFRVDLDDPRPVREQSMVEVSPNDVIRVRKLIRTNYQFPAHRFEAPDLPYSDNDQNLRHITRSGSLVVRWQYITTFRTEHDRLLNAKFPRNYQSRKLVRLTDEECDKGYSVPDFVQRYQWRGDVLAGSKRRELRERGRNIHPATRSSLNNKNSVSIDISDDEDMRPLMAKDPEVLIEVAGGGFKTVEPNPFRGNIRKSNAKMELQRTTRRKTAIRPKPAVYQYSYGDACKFLITLAEELD